ncbi:hypothetical protein RvY_00874-2 [Ramazzottius varieornatus]|uniref:BTB domain-containing protein n=1 Tax=Ramazzottius varieornatus TaxID=947166 RepID=A0A1D1UEB1_RAMVA|nr:hypothetical protein RvY_00874-2 [Ramazzottius varieornatus]
MKKCNWGWQGSAKKLADRGAYLLKNLPFPADIVFECDHDGVVETIPAHKIFLVIGSEVFEAMFCGLNADPLMSKGLDHDYDDDDDYDNEDEDNDGWEVLDPAFEITPDFKACPETSRRFMGLCRLQYPFELRFAFHEEEDSLMPDSAGTVSLYIPELGPGDSLFEKRCILYIGTDDGKANDLHGVVFGRMTVADPNMKPYWLYGMEELKRLLNSDKWNGLPYCQQCRFVRSVQRRLKDKASPNFLLNRVNT